MLDKLITSEVIKVKEKCEDWREAITLGVDVLINKGSVKKDYEDAIFRNFKNLGPYMVIAPGIVLSHARPEDGVLETSMSLVTLENPIEFGSELNDPVNLVITLAATDSTGHMGALANLMELFMNNEDLNKVIKADKKEEILEIINKYSK